MHFDLHFPGECFWALFPVPVGYVCLWKNACSVLSPFLIGWFLLLSSLDILDILPSNIRFANSFLLCRQPLHVDRVSFAVRFLV